MTENNRSGLGTVAPWRRGIPWWAVLLEGIAAFVLGALILARPQSVGQWLVVLVGAYVLITGLLDLYIARFGALPPGTAANRTLVGRISVVAALLVFVLPLFVAVSTSTQVAILGVTLVAIGFLGIAESLLGYGDHGIRWSAALGNLLHLLFGGLLLYVVVVGAGPGVLWWLGFIALVGGVALCSYAIVLYRRPGVAT